MLYKNQHIHAILHVIGIETKLTQIKKYVLKIVLKINNINIIMIQSINQLDFSAFQIVLNNHNIHKKKNA